MEWLTPLIPATVIAAVALFVVREVVEGVRRWRADARKGRAFRTLLARECELNHWTHKRLKEALLAIKENFENEVAAEYAVNRLSSGDVVFRQKHKGRIQGESSLPEVRTELMSKLMLDVAILDQSLFTYLGAAYDSAMNMRHVRESIITFTERDDEDEFKVFLESFADYGLSELNGVLDDMDKLYRQCTGKELKPFRLR